MSHENTLPNETKETDIYHGEIPVRISKELLQELSKLNQFKSVFAVAGEWFLIFAGVVIAEAFWNPLVYVLAVLWIGSRLHALGILLHEGAHYRLLKNRKWNDAISEVLLAWPLTITMYGYRKSHWAHHYELNTSRDPDWAQDIKRPEFQFPKTKGEIGKICLKYLVGYYGIAEMKNASEFRAKVPAHIEACRFAFYGAIAVMSIVFGFWAQLLLYWLVPLMTSFLLLMYIRAVADHHAGLAHDHIYSEARTTILPWWESLLFAPHFINYHIEHHFYPSVPFYNLPRLHRELLKDSVYQKKAHITKGICTGLLRECQECEPLPEHLTKV